ncbi:MAG: VIT domain-containing protein [Verrucomicrobiales bacterium]|nr:MAG: VWA domain-containing protein [Verrucomicrobiaceae bacterium]
MKKYSNFLIALSICFASCVTIIPEKSSAHGFIITDEPFIFHHPPRPPHPPFPRPPRPIHRFLPLELRKNNVSVKIKNQVAHTTVEQTFYNPSRQRVEGTYMFPIPKDAKIEKFEMEVNGKMTEAELLDAKKAKQIYEKIVRESRDPALMEYSDHGMFKIRIFPIEPGKEKNIKIKYTEILKRDGRITSYHYAMRAEKFLSVPVKNVSVKVTIESDKELKSIYSPSHQINVNRKGKKRAVIGYEEENLIPDTNFELLLATDLHEESPIGFDFLTHNENESGQGYYAMLLSPGSWENKEAIPKDIVFAIDTSGSMRVKKLDQAKAALEFCIDQLNPEDRFDIIRYSTETETLFNKLRTAKEQQTKEAKEFVKGLKAGGGTAIEEALVLAIETISKQGNEKSIRPRQIIFITDGRPTIGETRTDKIIDRLVKKRQKIKGNMRIFSFGIGTDINTKLLDLISQETKASTEYVLPEENIEHKVSRFYEKVSQPVMANISIKTEGNVRLNEQHPNDLPDLFKGDQLVIFGRYKTKKKETDRNIRFELDGNIAGKKVNLKFETKIEKKSKNSFIPKLWATRRVGYLLEEIRLHGENKELKDEVVSLSRNWGIVTPYTSYLIIEDEESRGIPVAQQSMGNRLGFSKLNSDSANTIKSKATPSSKDQNWFQRDLEKESFRRLSKNDSGSGAVAAARASEQLKQANQSKAFKSAYKEAQYGNQISFEQQATRTIAGKTFFQNEESWIDSLVPEQKDRTAKRLEFGSKEYFKLLNQDANTAKWLSVSVNMQIIINGTLYEIFSPKS